MNGYSSGKCSSFQIPINKLMKFIILRNPNTEDFTPIKLNVSPVQGTSRESLYKEIGLESLQCRLWYWKILFFYKILKV